MSLANVTRKISKIFYRCLFLCAVFIFEYTEYTQFASCSYTIIILILWSSILQTAQMYNYKLCLRKESPAIYL